MNRSRDPLTTPQRQQQRVCYALRAVAQSIEESPWRHSGLVAANCIDVIGAAAIKKSA